MFWLYKFVHLRLSTWRNYGIISVKQIFPYENPFFIRIYLTFYWYIQEICTNLLCMVAKRYI
ncbi:hypothetical protein HMPREF9446_03961 [Bacteroides fluxus YIT 12057]|uniref:Uncharacterized protein n=1 Tax=Bacteroides fluxus YIT 12057 TaxID=763034 RepID=F3PYQ5_9BACE|nr:hypothetical protein HMPREF9446_03961 [Bacteroides fluxus YIT 12057]